MHVAGALGVPFIALFGPTATDRRMPLNGVGRALFNRIQCSPCDSASCNNPVFRECMKQISVDDVMRAASEHFAALQTASAKD
jgi:ADP-heptose:LPS heptosyltransferase